MFMCSHVALNKILFYKVCDRPIIHLLDTPGVLPPKIENIETGMKLALCGKFTNFKKKRYLSV